MLLSLDQINSQGRLVPAAHGTAQAYDNVGKCSSLADSYRVIGAYAGRILKGEKPGQLPVDISTKFELVINLKTAKAFGLAIPESFLSRADAVIE
jgi:putative ABC transport system substrate-binding protein